MILLVARRAMKIKIRVTIQVVRIELVIGIGPIWKIFSAASDTCGSICSYLHYIRFAILILTCLIRVA